MEKKRSASFGKYLKTVRLEKGIKLSEIAAQTKVSKVTLELIEAEDHPRLPAEVFVKGFLRAYAKVVSADGDVAVDSYVESRRLLDENARSETDEARSRSRFGVRMLLCGVIFAAIIVVAVLTLQTEKPAEKPTPAVPAEPLEKPAVKAPAVVAPEGGGAVKKTSGTVPLPATSAPGATPAEPAPPFEPAQTEKPEPQPEPQPELKPELKSEPAPAPKPMGTTQVPAETATPESSSSRLQQQINIQAVDDTWLKVIVDGLKTNEYSLAPGDRLELKAEKGFNLLIGNATGIQLSYNGKPVAVPGKSGQVVTLQLP